MLNTDHTGNTYDTIAAAEFILANTKPETMADVVWDDTRHFLSGATSSISGTERVMLAGLDFDDMIANVEVGVNLFCSSAPESLTPNGKRYKLVEDTTPDHPEFLETTEDYENAPVGTIVVAHIGYPWVKEAEEWRSPDFKESSIVMATSYIDRRRVLRWGAGEGA